MRDITASRSFGNMLGHVCFAAGEDLRFCWSLIRCKHNLWECWPRRTVYFSLFVLWRTHKLEKLCIKTTGHLDTVTWSLSDVTEHTLYSIDYFSLWINHLGSCSNAALIFSFGRFLFDPWQVQQLGGWKQPVHYFCDLDNEGNKSTNNTGHSSALCSAIFKIQVFGAFLKRNTRN